MQFIKQYIPKKYSYLFTILLIFIIWRIFLLIPFSSFFDFLPLQITYLGGELKNYSQNPVLWSGANFDGKHYLSIAQFGYRPLTYFFFPLYPTLIQKLQSIFQVTPYLYSGLVISHISFLVGLIGLFLLGALDYKKRTVWTALVFLVLFPTAFYFIGVYTESIFFALVVWSFYAARKRMWVFAVLLAALSTATRIVGIAMLPALLCEFFLQQKTEGKTQKSWIVLLILLFVPLGLFCYMYFLQKTTGDPLAFFHSVEIFGEQRSTRLILLPQVFYRYIFNILPVMSRAPWQVIFTTGLELIAGALLLILSIISFKKLRLSYAIYLSIGYIIPTLSGSFSSLPRYTLVLFPAFFLLAILSERIPHHKMVKIINHICGHTSAYHYHTS